MGRRSDGDNCPKQTQWSAQLCLVAATGMTSELADWTFYQGHSSWWTETHRAVF